MKKEDFQVSVDAQRIEFTKPVIFKDGAWLVPLGPFAKQLGLKVEYPEGTEMVVLCGGVESELCVPLQFQDSKEGAVAIAGCNLCANQRTSRKPSALKFTKHRRTPLEIIQPTHLAPELTLPDLEG